MSWNTAVPSKPMGSTNSRVISILLKGKNESPTFQTLNEDGKSTSPIKCDIRGKFLLLDFGGRWCPYCVQFGPQVKQIWDGPRGWKRNLLDHKIEAEVVLVSCDKSEDQFMEHLGVLPSSTLGIPPGDPVATKLREEFGITGFPTAVLVDPQGQVITTKGRTFVTENKLVLSAADLRFHALLTGQSREVPKNENYLIRMTAEGDCATVAGKELRDSFSKNYVLVVHGSTVHPDMIERTTALLTGANRFAESQELQAKLKVSVRARNPSPSPALSFTYFFAFGRQHLGLVD